MGRLVTRLRAWSWKRWTIVGLVVFVVGSIGSVELTSQSWFCNSCHIMNPYYDSWKISSHKDIECVSCHIAPGVDNFIGAKLNGLGQVVDDVLRRTSTKPSASVSQFSCTRSGCHSVETLNAKQIDNGRFKFRHDKHLGAKHLGVEISCGTCHSHVKGEKHFQVSTSVCITCHLTERSHDQVAGNDAKNGVIRMAVRLGHTQASPTVVKAAEPSPDTPDAAESPEARIPGAPEEPGSEAPADSGDTAADTAPLSAEQPAEISSAVTVPAAPAEAPSPHGERVPPTSCLSCHEPPKGQFEYRGMKVDHSVFLSYGATCESCHRGVTATPPPMDDGRCLQCHTFGVEKSLESHEMHRVHTLGRHKIECFSCHGDIRHGPEMQAASQEEFDCRKCHTNQHNIQRDTYFNYVAAEAKATAVSPMFLAHVDCTGCHIKPREVESKPDSGAQVFVAGPEACDACHKPGYGAQIIPLWQKTTKTMFEQAEKDLAKTRAVSGADPALIAEAEGLIRLVREDGSWGVHNPRYSQHILEQARARLSAARAGSTGTPK
ncbi:MAG: NapC/NirT family cytochrome c [Phycisphaerales bacterium]|nr:NapC/NirT family cytochrome c [Phycisphaerales bacterium]